MDPSYYVKGFYRPFNFLLIFVATVRNLDSPVLPRSHPLIHLSHAPKVPDGDALGAILASVVFNFAIAGMLWYAVLFERTFIQSVTTYKGANDPSPFFHPSLFESLLLKKLTRLKVWARG
jgi:hypothetical protein